MSSPPRPDLPADLTPVHDHLRFLSPMSRERAEGLASWLVEGLAEGGTLLDAGCGWGELALLVAAAAPHGRVVGVDLDGTRVEEGRRRAASRGLGDRVEFLQGDVATAGPSPVDALVAVGASQAWGATGDDPGPLDYAAALTALRARVVRGARVLYGEGIWSRSPTAEATAPLSGRADEFVDLPTLVELAVSHGFAPVVVQEASLAEWDEFESCFVARYAAWLAAHDAGHPASAAVRAAADGQRAAYLRGYRGVLGMAYLQLLAV